MSNCLTCDEIVALANREVKTLDSQVFRLLKDGWNILYFWSEAFGDRPEKYRFTRVGPMTFWKKRRGVK